MKSIITKLVLLFSLVLLVVCGTLGVVSYNFSSKAVVNEVDITFEQLAESGAMIVEEYVNAQIDSLEVLANNAFIRNPAISIGDKMEILMEEIERAGHIRMGIADLSGSLTSSNGAVSDIKDRSYFRDAAAGKPSVSDPIVSKVDGSVIMTYAVPITYNGQISAVLIAIRDGYDLSNLTDKLVFGEFGEAFILNKDGTTVAYNDRELVEKMDNDFENVKTDPELADLVELEKKMVAGEKGVGSYTYHGGIEFMGYAPVVGTAWSLAVVAPQTEVMAGVNNLRQVILLVSVIFLLIGIGAAYLIARSIVAPLRGVILEIQEVAKGNLARDNVNVKTKDEVGILGDAFNTMLDNLRTLVKTVSNMAEQVAASSEELTASAEQQAQAANEVSSVVTNMAQGAEQQASAVDGITAAVEESSATMEQMAANSNVVAQQTNEAALAATEGQEAAKRAVDQMKNIDEVSSKVQDAVDRLAKSSREIDEITNVITGIAEQTNLLALNAAIEAARAGEQGRGFAVVAEEVRKLAEQSQEAAKQIAELITQNQVNINDAVTSIEISEKDIKVGIEVVNIAGQAFEEINDLSNKVSGHTQEMSVAIQQMAQGSQAIVDSVREVDVISKENMSATQTVSAATEEQTASVEEIASASQNLAAMAESLQQTVNQFKMK